MDLFVSIYKFLNTFFNILSFKSKPKKEKINDDENIAEEYDFLILNERE